MPPLIEALTGALEPLRDKPFAIFGHDLGALIGFELARALRRKADTRLQHLFVGAHRAPQIPSTSSPVYNLPLIEFESALQGRVPSAILENAEIVQQLLPALHADFALDETYTYQAESPLQIPISAYGALEDLVVAQAELQAWRDQTTAPFRLQMYPNDHFFIHSAQTLLLQSMYQELAAM